MQIIVYCLQGVSHLIRYSVICTQQQPERKRERERERERREKQGGECVCVCEREIGSTVGERRQAEREGEVHQNLFIQSCSFH